MPRFTMTPPTDALPRAQMELPAEARPEDFALPEVTADPTAHVPETAGPPEGLPAIPVIEMPEGFPQDDLPEEAEDGWSHAPWA